ncbi:hypothetical protein CXF80_18205 [Shewanella sp. Actino-trap-3]|uniref:hypothetical protein n=1 Tax=Shewanella sp. Actino-trap-3 TaxID=2058331 RepID=UPI000C3233F1|nr:hypothetical protein [Shewanella sp. Actino-trap-3]PKG80075.1 hypothetical protein CXF80_18205 [Shewanella sp. Actino-trap-3]
MFNTTIDTIVLTEPLLWLNRNNTQRVAANMKRALNGAPHIQQTVIPAGITLELGSKNSWMLRSEFEQLQAHAATKLTEFTINHDGTVINVMWDNTQSNVITADDVDEELGAYPLLTNVVLRFITL